MKMDLSEMDLLGKALVDYQTHGKAAVLSVIREDGVADEYPPSALFTLTPDSEIEKIGIAKCRGRTLDVGAGAGRHTLLLQDRGVDVEAIDISEDAVAVMRQRGVKNARRVDVFDLQGVRYDTILMLQHGLGITKTLAGLTRYLTRMTEILAPAGSILADSLDVTRTSNPTHLAYQASLKARGKYHGEMTFRLKYGDQVGEPFEWLHVDFDTLSAVASQTGWSAERVVGESSGDYLCCLRRAV
jgi:SAM-dependent methyltransferase